ncbi:hypothetical protein HMPREF3022_02325 [Neisseria sp. HMSC065C04]|uniref:hypothetical protein n=1 Tax=Neisseria sp. HMSC065C04 TaxID=1739524 RepID=UPI0008A2FDDD|nr:hypothetical protein [Neisseria sp. HMSC065C04]OFO64214.1 hypothetical protein HMPREF3022_02325 [Neisseria sp. HMSC065C04]
MSKNQKLLIAAVLLIVFAAAKLLLLDWWQQQQSKTKVVECNLTQGCVLPDGSKVRATSINTHEPFDIVIENVPQNTGAVSISFSMKNMDMGFNRYNLTKQSPRSWQALQIRLPFCVEGRHDYTADITVGKQTFQTAFSAN